MQRAAVTMDFGSSPMKGIRGETSGESQKNAYIHVGVVTAGIHGSMFPPAVVVQPCVWTCLRLSRNLVCPVLFTFIAGQRCFPQLRFRELVYHEGGCPKSIFWMAANVVMSALVFGSRNCSIAVPICQFRGTCTNLSGNHAMWQHSP